MQGVKKQSIQYTLFGVWPWNSLTLTWRRRILVLPIGNLITT
jgi:hypothetical protein